jgi:hypothetical protein
MFDYKIVSCASFGNTGSGVITDYLSEFDCIHNPGDYEFRFLHDYGGVSTLEDCLVYNYHRQNSDIAIQNFIKYINLYGKCCFGKQYEKYFNGQFKKKSYEFLDKITDVCWDGSWGGQMILSSFIHYPIFKHKVLPRLLNFLLLGKHHSKYTPRDVMYYSNPSSEYFSECVKEYINKLCFIIDPKNKYTYLYFDQLVPSINIERYFKYFDSLHVIVVDRDPRDLYLDNLLNWQTSWIPSDLNKFIILYKKIRQKLPYEKENPNVLRIKFEDTVYKYNDFSKKINTFLSLKESEHKSPKTRFNPDVSVKNTQLWKTQKTTVDITKIVKTIEDNLGDYCYQF